MLLVNNLVNKPDSILSRVCPATKLANNRTPRENALAIYEINSISTSKGTNPNGVPLGIKKAKKPTWCLYNPNIVTPMNIVKLRPNDTIIEVVTV